MKVKIKENINLEELEKFGFKKRYTNSYEYIRNINNKTVYRVFTTLNHKYLQIEILEPSLIAGSLQCLIYDLCQANLIEKVEG